MAKHEWVRVAFSSFNPAGGRASEEDSVLSEEWTVWSGCRDGEEHRRLHSYKGERRMGLICFILVNVESVFDIYFHIYPSVDIRARWAAERCPAGGSPEGPCYRGRGFCSRQPVWRAGRAKAAGPHPGENAAAYRADAGECCPAPSWQHGRPGKGHPWSSWYLEEALVCWCLVNLVSFGLFGSETCLLASGQREEEEVRRRCASIMYSDPLFWDKAGTTGKT